jgi:hypothetical protein
VTGEVNPAALEDLIRLCAELDKRRRAEDHNENAGDPAPDTPAEEALEPGDHQQGRRPIVGTGRPGELPAPPAAGGGAGRAEPAAGRRRVRRHPGGDPAGGDPARSALPVPRRLRTSPRPDAEVPPHLRHRKDGGRPTSVKDCAPGFVSFNHQVCHPPVGAWTVVLNP